MGDSFKGLPEAWTGATQLFGELPSGHFALDQLPRLEDNVELVVGYFNETLPDFVGKHLAPSSDDILLAYGSKTLRLLHLDADLFSSTLDVLTELAPFIRPGCLVVI